jgi:hypothetical protein
MNSSRQAPEPGNLSIFLEYFKKRFLKDVTHKAGALQGAKAQWPTLTKIYRGFALIWLKTVPTVCGTRGWTRPKQTPL